ncbi:MAG: DUF429 domain-containing protein [Methanobacteriota archaeon]|nr:MAG: DUF429 domain-containing protein [Euryarchaeota archaeon]
MIIGIDLAKDGNKTGIAYFVDGSIRTATLTSIEEVISISLHFKMAYIDAPLSLPYDRKSIDHNNGNNHRQCDKMLLLRHVRFFPISLGPMRELTREGIKLSSALSSHHLFVHEAFPGAFYDAFSIDRKDIKEQKIIYKKLGFTTRAKNQHESDAIACLLTGLLDTRGEVEHYYGLDGCIAVPRPYTKALL